MMVSSDRRTTAVVRRLHVGDIFRDEQGTWKVTERPEVVQGNGVNLCLRRMTDSGKKARPGAQAEVFVFDRDARVHIIRP